MGPKCSTDDGVNITTSLTTYATLCMSGVCHTRIALASPWRQQEDDDRDVPFHGRVFYC